MLEKKSIKKSINQFISFGIVGVINTIVGTIVMFSMYNLLGFGYWISSASNYIVGSICSYVLNKKYTFRVRDTSVIQILRFIINISVCYALAYGVARNLISYILDSHKSSTKIIENISMVVGMFIFVILNFLGQKIFVFKKKG